MPSVGSGDPIDVLAPDYGDERFTESPEAFCQLGVAGLCRRCAGLAFEEVAARHTLHHRRGGEIHRGVGSLFGRLHEDYREFLNDGHQRPIVGAEASADSTGVHCIGCHSRGREALRELQVEEDVAAL